MFCKVYYKPDYNMGRTSTETISNFLSCSYDGGKGMVFKFGDLKSPTEIIRRIYDIEDIKIFNENPMIC